jgi:hypothetical protein
MHQVERKKEVSVTCTRFHENHEKRYSNNVISLKKSDITSGTLHIRIHHRISATLGMAYTAV